MLFQFNSSESLETKFLEIDDMTSPSIFVEVTRPTSHFICRFVFYRTVFCGILQFVLYNSQSLRFLAFISKVSIENSAKFVRLACLEVAFPNFGILVCNLQTGPLMSRFFFDFVPPYRYQHLLKFYNHTYCRYFRGMFPPPQMPLSCLKR